MMKFEDRKQAGMLLAEKLIKYKGKDAIVLALPRGGVVTAAEIAKHLNAPFDLVITRKIGHPYNPEYAIGAITDNGTIIGVKDELEMVDKGWLKSEIKKERTEALRRKKLYLRGRKEIALHGKTVILVDDGIATGLTMRAAVSEVRKQSPAKIIVAVPVIPQESALVLKQEADEVVALNTVKEGKFLGAIGSYYDEFLQVTDQEVIDILKKFKRKEGYDLS